MVWSPLFLTQALCFRLSVVPSSSWVRQCFPLSGGLRHPLFSPVQITATVLLVWGNRILSPDTGLQLLLRTGPALWLLCSLIFPLHTTLCPVLGPAGRLPSSSCWTPLQLTLSSVSLPPLFSPLVAPLCFPFIPSQQSASVVYISNCCLGNQWLWPSVAVRKTHKANNAKNYYNHPKMKTLTKTFYHKKKHTELIIWKLQNPQIMLFYEVFLQMILYKLCIILALCQMSLCVFVL